MNDFINFISALSLNRIRNIILNYCGYTISIIFKIPVSLSLPSYSSIEPTTRCNLKCPECPVGKGTLKRARGDMSISDYKEIIRSIQKHTSYLSVFFQGEPLLHFQISEMIKIANDYNIYTCISTNGHFLDSTTAEALIQSGLKRIIISLDGISSETYNKYRINGDFDKVIAQVKSLVNSKKKLKSTSPLIILQMIIFKQNEKDIPEFRELGRILGVDRVEIKTAQHYDLEHTHELITTHLKFRRYKQDKDGHWIIKKKLKNRCLRLWTHAVITWDGIVVPCCYDKDASFSMGNLRINTLAEIWNSEKFCNYRRKILKNRKGISICTNCRE